MIKTRNLLLNITILLALLVSAMYNIGCSEYEKKRRQRYTMGMVDQLIYVQDPRTGVCFVHNYLSEGDRLVYIPCTKKVCEQIGSSAVGECKEGK